MKLPSLQTQARRVAAFTLIEIAISLAVIGFALVAIIGVLPMGMQVQRDNREDTIINQDTTVWAGAIRNGARGMDDLTNYVFAITNYWTAYDVTPTDTNNPRSGIDGYSASGSDINSFTPAPFFPITNGLRIIGLVGRPKYQPFPGGFLSNHIVAFVRSMSGLAAEKSPQTNADVVLDSFSYRLICENMQVPMYVSLNQPSPPFENRLTNNLSELRLTFRWPLSPAGVAGNGRQTFRLLVGGRPVVFNDPVGHPLFFFQPQVFAQTPP